MPGTPTTQRLVNGSTGDPLLYLDFPGRHNAILMDCGDNAALSPQELADVEVLLLTHHHMDHTMGLDRLLRANLDTSKSLVILGPPQTIEHVFARIQAYEITFYPFMELEIEVRECHEEHFRIGRFGCSTKLQTLDIDEEPRTGVVGYEHSEGRIEVVTVEHTVPTLSFAWIQPAGFQVNAAALAAGPLKPGPWIGELLQKLRQEANPAETLSIGGGTYRLADLTRHYILETPGCKIVYLTDTYGQGAIRPRLIAFAKQAQFLYGDSFYAKAQTKEASKHKHCRTVDIAEIAKAAKVEQLILMHHAKRYEGDYARLCEEARAIFPRVSQELRERPNPY